VSASKLTLSFVPSDAPVSSAPDDWFGIPLDVFSLGGAKVGTASSCVHSIDGCDPFVPFCRQTVQATLTLALAGGTITAPLELREILPTEFSFLQRGSGTITGGTGAYAGSRGHIKGGGAGEFTDTGFVGNLVYVVHLKGAPRMKPARGVAGAPLSSCAARVRSGDPSQAADRARPVRVRAGARGGVP
jgi:hypothetical protein